MTVAVSIETVTVLGHLQCAIGDCEGLELIAVVIGKRRGRPRRCGNLGDPVRRIDGVRGRRTVDVAVETVDGVVTEAL